MACACTRTAPWAAASASHSSTETRRERSTSPCQLPSRLEYILTAGVPIEGAVHPLQSRGVRLNGGDELSLQPSSKGPPSLPELHGLSVAQSGASGARVPAGSLGFDGLMG